jgi:hypothetical protein
MPTAYVFGTAEVYDPLLVSRDTGLVKAGRDEDNDYPGGLVFPSAQAARWTLECLLEDATSGFDPVFDWAIYEVYIDDPSFEGMVEWIDDTDTRLGGYLLDDVPILRKIREADFPSDPRLDALIAHHTELMHTALSTGPNFSIEVMKGALGLIEELQAQRDKAVAGNVRVVELAIEHGDVCGVQLRWLVDQMIRAATGATHRYADPPAYRRFRARFTNSWETGEPPTEQGL